MGDEEEKEQEGAEGQTPPEPTPEEKAMEESDAALDSLTDKYDPEKAPADGDETPGEGGETPGDGDQTPGEGGETPGDGDQKPGEGDGTPAEGADKDGFTDEDKQDTPEGLNPKQQHAFWKARKEKREVREEYERKLAEATKEPPNPDEEPGAGESGPLKVEQVAGAFDMLARAEGVLDGTRPLDGVDSDAATKAKEMVVGMLAELKDPAQLLDVIQKARAGQLGEYSEDIADLAERELPLVQARAGAAAQDASRQQEELQQLQGKVKEQLDEAFKKYPELTKDEPGKESKEVLFAREWMEQNVLGTPDNRPDKFADLFRPEKIPGLVDEMMNAFRAAEYQELQAEVERMRRERDGDEAPLGAEGRPGGNGRAVAPGSDAALDSMFAKYGQ